MSTRDKTIDRLRGFAMLWVIVVHVLYWGNFFSSEYINLAKSFCLFEMPLFFFITGASTSFSQTNNYLDFVKKRFKRILIPYWVYAIICAAISIIKLKEEMSPTGLEAIIILVSWLIPVDRQITSIPCLTWALWFIPVYLCIVLLLPGLKKMRESKKKDEFGCLLLAVFGITCLLKAGWIQNVAFYAFWTYVGLFYEDIKNAIQQKHKRIKLYRIAAANTIALILLYLANQPLDMQYNKFPPNMMFLVFSFTMMPLIILLSPFLNKFFERIERYRLIGKIFTLYSTRSMTIFLYQVFAFMLSVPIANTLLPGETVWSSVMKCVICLALTIPTCSVLAITFGSIEKIGKPKKQN